MKKETKELIKKKANHLYELSNKLEPMDSLIRILRMSAETQDPKAIAYITHMVADKLEEMDRYASIWCDARDIIKAVDSEPTDPDTDETEDDIPIMEGSDGDTPNE